MAGGCASSEHSDGASDLQHALRQPPMRHEHERSYPQPTLPGRQRNSGRRRCADQRFHQTKRLCRNQHSWRFPHFRETPQRKHQHRSPVPTSPEASDTFVLPLGQRRSPAASSRGEFADAGRQHRKRKSRTAASIGKHLTFQTFTENVAMAASGMERSFNCKSVFAKSECVGCSEVSP